jgi:hypothetical protein
MKTKSIVTMRAVILSYVLLLVPPLFARESTDEIVMKNGDHLTGEIKGLKRRCALHEHAIHTGNKFASLVECGPAWRASNCFL